jgi:uncharacterized protein (DUF362 family)
VSKLVQIWGAIKPSVTILDGVLAMEGRAGAKAARKSRSGFSLEATMLLRWISLCA